MICEALINDIPVIAALEKECIDSAWTEDMLYEAYEDKSYKFFVASNGLSDNRIIVGYIYIKSVFDEAEVCNIAVDAKHRQKGYAKKLLDSAEKYCAEIGAKKIFLEVAETNLPARKLYNKCGYAELTVRKNYYKNGDNAVVMSKIL